MREARSRRWKVGDRFYYNRWSEAHPDPLVFEITKITPNGIVWFWCPEYDRKPDRRIPKSRLYQETRRRELVRL